jgi:uncharacterized membrane protein
MKNSIGSLLLGAAVAGIFAAALPAHAQKIPAEKLKKMEVVPCYGVNSCKGGGQCSGMGHQCAGENSCRGQGWLPIPKDACLKIESGSLTPKKS